MKKGSKRGRCVLAGDIGGTRARFALFSIGDGASPPKLAHQDVLDSRAFRTFQAALGRFLSGWDAPCAIAAASFGIAGPVVEQRVKTTNLPWTIDAAAIGRAFEIPKVTLLNDLVAVGLGAMASPASKLVSLQGGRPKKNGANVAVIAAGTGLGEASFVWDGESYVACATEGSHVDFAPRTEVEEELRDLLRREYGHVSYERIASGSTISVVYHFLRRNRGMKETDRAASYVANASDPNVAVVELAESKKSKVAAAALDLWASVYGAEAGNLALKCLSTGGVYVCGGVSARLAPMLGRKNGPFLEAFLDKGRMRALLEATPVAVCLEPRAGLLGAVTHAAHSAAS